MTWEGLEPTVTAPEWAKTVRALDRSATVSNIRISGVSTDIKTDNHSNKNQWGSALDSSGSQSLVTGFCEHGNELLDSIKDGRFANQFCDCRVVKHSAPCSTVLQWDMGFVCHLFHSGFSGTLPSNELSPLTHENQFRNIIMVRLVLRIHCCLYDM
jgi:hypothetical protein